MLEDQIVDLLKTSAQKQRSFTFTLLDLSGFLNLSFPQTPKRPNIVHPSPTRPPPPTNTVSTVHRLHDSTSPPNLKAPLPLFQSHRPSHRRRSPLIVQFLRRPFHSSSRRFAYRPPSSPCSAVLFSSSSLPARRLRITSSLPSRDRR
ncbi:hypothetical protein PIB30_016427 [Stylosanthes scabra]|uniref:Uncharacterized protein n=1 Tax=Stylosanthes scabra TaxID=79078 RepID=A0ABU6W753_9FABA|nr:hypothetical protein [Stylosanthes scabra]